MVVSSPTSTGRIREVEVVQRDDIAVRFCGDSGDGMQLAGTQMTSTSAIFGNDVSTLPDFPAEIRAPAGSLAGVSGFQLNFGSYDLRTPGDKVSALVAMNPAGLKTNINDLEPGGMLIVNEDAFNEGNLIKAGYKENPLNDASLKQFQLFRVPMDKLTEEACAPTGLTGRSAGRCRNFTALGLVYWLFGRPMEPTLRWIEEKFGKKRNVADANIYALKAGYFFGETAEMFPAKFIVAPAKIARGKYRRISGNE
ncbi:MAG: 2-oxoacid:acceptor oxidoreductase family protein, partial [Planctomycetota bacterium]